MEEIDINFNIMRKVHGAQRERNRDKYGKCSEFLDRLSKKLEELNIHTSGSLLYDLSECSRKYNISFDKGIKIVLEQELVVPEYTYGGLVTHKIVKVKSVLPSNHHIVSNRRKK